MFSYVTDVNFFVKKGKINVACRDNITVLTFIDKGCKNCTKAKNELEDLSYQYPEINFAFANISQNIETLKIFKDNGYEVKYTPTYVLFRIGVFDSIIDLEVLTRENIVEAIQLSGNDETAIPDDDIGYSLFD